MTLFDMEPLTRAQAIRSKGRHPITLLPLDPDESRTCGNCANRRWVFDEDRCEHHGTVCCAVSQCQTGCGTIADWAEGPPWTGYCEDPCCTANSVPNWPQYRPWPWEEATEPDMPACSAWRDLEAERVVYSLTRMVR